MEKEKIQVLLIMSLYVLCLGALSILLFILALSDSWVFILPIPIVLVLIYSMIHVSYERMEEIGKDDKNEISNY